MNSDTRIKPEATTTSTIRYLILLVVVVTGIFWLVSRWAIWHGQGVSLPRYCTDIEGSLHTLKEVLEGAQAFESYEQRRPALVAAKLLYLIPQTSDETTDEYLDRLYRELRMQCH